MPVGYEKNTGTFPTEEGRGLKIYEAIEYTDGGPTDQGKLIGHHTARSEKELRERLGINHGFIQFYEISLTTYRRRRAKALAMYPMDL